MKKQQSLVLAFKDIRSIDLSLVGGKGANLGELTHAGFPIPTGFCVTTVAFQEFVNSYPTIAELYDDLEIVSNDVEQVRSIGAQVRERLSEVEIPQKIVNAVKQKWQELGADEAYAVRSSATAEDLPDASFAGQQDTYLNIIGENALLDAIRNCWISLFTDRAILYRYQNGFDHREVYLSVVVQQMVMSHKSGILFTADPLTGHRHTSAIDASYGLGEALVSGLVSPDAYRVDKRNYTIIDRQIADKQIAIYPLKNGGVRQENLSEAQRHQTVLNDTQIIQLAQMGSRIEDYYGAPQDIEWAIVEEDIFLLQARPITSLYPIDGLRSPDGSLHTYFSMGHQQNMTNVMSPMAASALRCIIPLGKGQNPYESDYMRLNASRLFLDITQPLRHPILGRSLPKMLGQFDALAPQTLALIMQRPEFQAPSKMKISWTAIRAIVPIIYRTVKAFWWQDLTGLVECVNEIVADHVQASQIRLRNAKTGAEQVQISIDIMQSFYRVVLKWVPYFVAGEIAKRLLVSIAGKWQDDIDLEALSLGLSGNVVTEMNLKIGDLADLARESPQLIAHFDTLADDSHTWLKEASTFADGASFIEAWDDFIAYFGARGSSEIDIMAQHWYEEPLPVLQVIASYLQKEKGDHRVQHQKLVHDRQQALSTLFQKAKKGVFGWVRLPFIKRLVHVMSEGSILREHHKFMVLLILRTVKETIKQQASDLTADEKIHYADDIWFFTLPELIDLHHGVDLRDTPSKRREQMARHQKMSPPMVITSDGEIPVVTYQLDDAPDGALLGNAVSAGVVEGRVRVILDPQIETIQVGEILVAPFTDPGWTPLFINAGGLVMEVGGIMTHGSVVAREYSIPAVVGVRDATTSLKTGQYVRVDGNRGIIEILEEK